jgi:hypothetical protein
MKSYRDNAFVWIVGPEITVSDQSLNGDEKRVSGIHWIACSR